MEQFIKPKVPKSTNKCIIIPPEGQTFITGLASSYNEQFPEQLRGIISYENYKQEIIVLNETIQNYWPCFCAQYGIGYTCCLCSCGLSLLIPKLCIKEAEDAAARQIDFMNKSLFNDQGLEIKIKKKCNNSWLEIYQINKQVFGKIMEPDADQSEQENFMSEKTNLSTSLQSEMKNLVFQ